MSKTILGAAVTIIVLVADILGIEADPDSINQLLVQGIAVAGSIFAIYGRIKATKGIGSE